MGADAETASDTDLDAALDGEQAHLDHAYACLAAMRERTSRLLADAPEDPDLLASLTRRLNQLTDGGRALCFGRIDTDTGESWHIGRRHVEDEDAEPVVVEWRAPVAVPFYRATVSEPLGLVRRRQLVVDGRRVLSLADDRFAGGGRDGAAVDTRVRARDALLAELERGRTGQMLDIVATIQAEQDEVIRAPQAGILVVQGGPGTGKTAIGLHRAAFLLYGNDDLARQGVLVVGPNRTFLRYIALVLPSLGEEAVVQATLSDLVPDAPVRAVDGEAAARAKGDLRWVEVLRRSLELRRASVDHPVEVDLGLRRLRISADEANAAAAEIATRRLPYLSGRAALRDRLVRLLYERHATATGTVGDTDALRRIGSQRSVRAALDVLWPSLSAPALVRQLVTRKAVLDQAAAGILDPHEIKAVLRRAGRSMAAEPWTEADTALVDEAADLLEGRSRTYGHVVVDEAQDLSPMQARMLARRCPSGSMTILGDLAQGTSVSAVDRWEDLVGVLPTPHGSSVRELRLGYRAPGRVLELASRLLPEIAPQLQPTESIRPGRTAPETLTVEPAEVPGAVAARAARLAGEHAGLVGVICPPSLVEPVGAALAGAGLDSGSAERDGLDHRVTLVAAATAKGLEFDAVVVVEPGRIAAEAGGGPRGLRLVYVALTRPTQHLTVVHAEPLPGALADAATAVAGARGAA